MANYEIIKEAGIDVLKVDYSKALYPPSIEDNGNVMKELFELLLANPSVLAVVFYQQKNYFYPTKQIKLLREFVNIYSNLIKIRKLNEPANVFPGIEITGDFAKKALSLNYLIEMLKSDPISAYVEFKRLLREEKVKALKISPPITEDITPKEHEALLYYINVLEEVVSLLDKCTLIMLAKQYLAGYNLGDRTIYSYFFVSSISPDYISTKIQLSPPKDGTQLAIYKINSHNFNQEISEPVGDAEIEEAYQGNHVSSKPSSTSSVTLNNLSNKTLPKAPIVNIYDVPNDTKRLYHLIPEELQLNEDYQELIILAKKAIEEHKPKEEAFLEPEKIRGAFTNIAKDLILEISSEKGIQIDEKTLNLLSKIIVRNTIGFGVIECILKDEKVQDLTLNAPMGESPFFIVHQDFGECFTNITPTISDFESWASKFRLMSGRPLDEANPILDTELILPELRARVALVHKPLNPYGIAMAFRRHADKPWTLCKYIKNRMLSPLAAGLLSFLVDGGRTFLIAGTRSSGKTSLLGAIMVEVMRKYRLLTIEDVLELPSEYLKKLGYNIQSLKVRSALMKGGAELGADEGIRTSLRMGDSAIIVGEVRSTEAISLYEAMRIGAGANLVAGTIHGDSVYGVFDRVVNDLGVPRTSFKATDIVIIVNPIWTVGALRKEKRLLSITEVRKFWEEDPLREGAFVELMKYEVVNDEAVPTPDLINGDSEVLKSIASNVKEWAGNWDAVWDNILLRGKIKELIVKHSELKNNPSLLEADFVCLANDIFHKLTEDVRNELGSLDCNEIYKRFEHWMQEMK